MLSADGVDTTHVVRRSDAYGLESFVMINPETGTRTKFPVRDFNPAIEWTDELKAEISRADVLHLDGTNYENALNASKIAKEANVLVSLDGCSMQAEMDKNRKLASMADFLIMNSKYPLRVTGLDNYENALLEISEWGPRIVICTLGDRGSLAVIDGKVVHFPAYKVNVVDTTGAGDVFHGAFIAGYLDGMDLVENIEFASAVSALKCQKLGGRAGIPTKEEALMKMHSAKE